MQDSIPNKNHCFYCFDVLKEHFDKSSNNTAVPNFENHKYPIFVTWKRYGNLRGCIGNFSELPLHSGLREYSLIAALEDSRFNPIVESEINTLDCTVSLLTDFETADDHMDWEIGRHGIRMRLNDKNNKYKVYSSTFLPQIAKEQGWTKFDTLDQLIYKSGFRGSITDEVYDSLSITRYQSRTCEVTYAEYTNRAL